MSSLLLLAFPEPTNIRGQKFNFLISQVSSKVPRTVKVVVSRLSVLLELAVLFSSSLMHLSL